MAEKTEKKAEEKAAAPAAAAPAAGGGAGAGEKKSAGGALKSLPVLLGIVMVVEAAILFAGFKLLGGGAAAAHGAALAETEGGESASEGHGGGHGAGAAKVDPRKDAEVKVLEFKAPNKLTGRTFLYDVVIYATVKGEVKKKVEDILADREARVKNDIRTIIAQMDPEKLNGMEPGLETLRRQVKAQLDEIVGDGLIDEVLVPRCIPYRADY